MEALKEEAMGSWTANGSESQEGGATDRQGLIGLTDSVPQLDFKDPEHRLIEA